MSGVVPGAVLDVIGGDVVGLVALVVAVVTGVEGAGVVLDVIGGDVVRLVALVVAVVRGVVLDVIDGLHIPPMGPV